VAAGYQGLDELTGQRFTPDPFAPTPGGRMYRSGDLARWLEGDQGELEVLGRIDSQLKVRGFRVEPGEIEAVLRQDEAVRDAVVVFRQDGAAGGQLTGYLVVDGGDPGAVVTRLREHARASLPDFMVPAHLVPLASLPLTANGKLDLAALPAPSRDRAEPAEFVAPRTPLEKSVAAVWQDVLGLDDIGVHDDFFASGGDSLLAVRTVFRLRAELSLDIPVRAMFDHPTVAALAAHLPASPPAAPPIPRRRRVAFQPAAGAGSKAGPAPEGTTA
jgi:acyl carrier protein